MRTGSIEVFSRKHLNNLGLLITGVFLPGGGGLKLVASGALAVAFRGCRA